MRTLFAILLLAIVGCKPTPDGKTIGDVKAYHYGVTLEIAEIDNHQYVVMDGKRSGGITHHFGCPCMEQTLVEKPE